MSLTGKATADQKLRGKINGLETLKGYSAYEIALIHGFEGTEEEWLASNKGDKGDQGIQGEKGDKGDTGDLASVYFTDDGNGNVIIGTKSAGMEVNLIDIGDGSVRLEVV